MHWVERAKHTTKYTLRAGKSDDVTEDSTGYVPGKTKKVEGREERGVKG